MQPTWNGICHRCGKHSGVHTMSMFNKQLICMDCAEQEEAHPNYDKASQADLKAIQGGNYNYQGIGLPDDL